MPRRKAVETPAASVAQPAPVAPSSAAQAFDEFKAMQAQAAPAPRATRSPRDVRPSIAPGSGDAGLSKQFEGMSEEAVRAIREQQLAAQQPVESEVEPLGVGQGNSFLAEVNDGELGQGDSEEVGGVQEDLQEAEATPGTGQDEEAAERDRALLIHVGGISPKIAKTLSDDALAALAATLRRAPAANTNTAASQVLSNGTPSVADSGATLPSLPDIGALLKPFSEHFDAEAAAALGKGLEGALKPMHQAMAALHEQNKLLRESVERMGDGQARSVFEDARAALSERFGQLRDNAMRVPLAEAMDGLKQTARFKDRPMDKATTIDLMRAAARALDLKESSPEERRAAVEARRVGQPHLGKPVQPNQRTGRQEAMTQMQRAAHLFSINRSQDAHALLNGLR